MQVGNPKQIVKIFADRIGYATADSHFYLLYLVKEQQP